MLRSTARGGQESARHTFLIRLWTAFAAVAVLTLGVTAAATSASAQPRQPAAAGRQQVTGHLYPVSGHHHYKAACAPARPGHPSCLVLVRTNVKSRKQPPGRPGQAPSGYGYGPSSLQSAYNLSAATGSGETVAVVDAYNAPDIVSDLATYRSAWGLPACGSGCFSVVNENGNASPLPPDAGDTGWDVEESLDVDMVSAICPLCHIILVEATSPSFSDLGTGVDAAVSLGADYVSNSYGAPDFSGETSYDTYYNHPGVAVTASAGDSGYGVGYPAASQYVTAVGGTSLSTADNGRGWTETVWSGTGSGCSAYEAKPSWQTDTGCSDRTDNDVAADADPDTGVAVYDSYSEGGWLEVGGTSESSPIIASVYALAGTPAAGSYPSSYIYAHTSDLYDVTSGSDGSCSPAYLCTGEVGYDGPTGWGTPDGTAAFSSGSSSNVTLTVTKSGTGAAAGKVSSSPSGISCGGTCSASYGSGSTVTLTATPAAGGVFTGWSGTASCIGMASSTCTLTLTANTTVSASFTASATLHQQTAASYTGTWKTSTCLCFSGGTDTETSASGASASYKFTGNLIQLVSAMGSTRGSFKVYIDGVYKTTISTYITNPNRNAVIVWQRAFSSVGTHTLKIVNVATSGHPRIDVDAFVVAT